LRLGTSVRSPSPNGSSLPDYETLTFDSIDTNEYTSEEYAGSSGAVTERLVIKVEKFMNRAWAEFFGVLRLVLTIVSTLIVQAVRFVAWLFKRIVVVPLLVIGDQIVRPYFFTIYSVAVYPTLVYLLAVFRGLLVFVRYAIDVFNAFVPPIAGILNAFRLVVVNQRFTGPINRTFDTKESPEQTV